MFKAEGEGLLKITNTARGMLRKDDEKNKESRMVYKTSAVHQWTISAVVRDSGNKGRTRDRRGEGDSLCALSGKRKNN